MVFEKKVAEILALSDIIKGAGNLDWLNHIYNKKGDYDHPQICYEFGIAFWKFGDRAKAKNCFIKGATYGISFPGEIYNHTFIDSIGQCFSLLVTQYPIRNLEYAYKASILAYIYLSRCIELYPRESQDSYRTRALLFKDHESPDLIKNMIVRTINFNISALTFVIADFYFASQAKDSPYQDCLESAERLFQMVANTKIQGRLGSSYTLNEIVEIGEERHFLLYKTLEHQFKSEEFNMMFNELQEMNSYF